MDYKEIKGEATAWQRAGAVSILNPLPGFGTPSITFSEQQVVSLDGKVIAVSGNGVGVVGSFDPGALIPLLNPSTGEPLGESVYQGELYVILYSLYMQLAAERDSRAEVQP